ncbi:hypothetical protein KI688_004953 [Linnemannia hyalina]|uniref:Uncharacterized protein n=1 Tax=Linnemannia hyalina TaxID=64524 RepID=A0A9P8BND1_9FUNG|nr:hypothetical protein KI688_004953 [Linnemannia hyalina]
MDADDFEDDMMMDEDELIAPSPTAEDIFEEDGRFAGPRVPNVKVVDKNFFNGKLSFFSTPPPPYGARTRNGSLLV